ncbi:UPF0187-domain-containing protein [Dentipellis sp. KUC8613]|nr:UPF0187-domain-containing protein [Dentipellis sp. KUC8613]
MESASVMQESHFFDIRSPDPFAPKRKFWPRFMNALLATALFRCWHILLFFAGWSTCISLVSNYKHNLGISSTLLTVLGTVLGFVISYRTTSSFERYNEGRRYWSQIVLASRTFARTVWFHVPETMAIGPDSMPLDEKKARVIIEKKTVINLVEAFSVAIKHYLRGEEGIYYVDLYHLVKFLPAYALPAGLPSAVDLTNPTDVPGSPVSPTMQRRASNTSRRTSVSHPHFRQSDAGHGPRPIVPPPPSISTSASEPHLPLPVSSPPPGKNAKTPATTFLQSVPERLSVSHSARSAGGISGKESFNLADESFLFPARMPPKYHFFDLFPFSLFVRLLTKDGHDIKGKKGARMRAKIRSRAVTHNLPLEISLYLSSWIAALQARKAIDPPTTTMLITTLNQLVDALTGLERILTTPIPFSYSVHLWAVTTLYCMFLPFQLWLTLKWITIPGTIIASFIFFGFLVAGEEIENPFGYDKNDLNMDHFTNVIIRNELRAITATPAPNPADWAFSPVNNLLFNAHREGAERVAPEEWVKRGHATLLSALASAS